MIPNYFYLWGGENWDRALFCNPGWPQTYNNPPPLASWVLGVQVWAQAGPEQALNEQGPRSHTCLHFQNKGTVNTGPIADILWTYSHFCKTDTLVCKRNVPLHWKLQCGSQFLMQLSTVYKSPRQTWAWRHVSIAQTLGNRRLQAESQPEYTAIFRPASQGYIHSDTPAQKATIKI